MNLEELPVLTVEQVRYLSKSYKTFAQQSALIFSNRGTSACFLMTTQLMR